MGKILIIKGADFSSVALGTAPIGYPTITILDGMVTITLDGAENIYYTIDGSIPTKNSTKYTEPFTVEDRTTIKAIAEFTDGAVSRVSSLTYYSGGNRSITVVADPTNAGTVSGSGEYQYGERVTISATPNEGYEFKRWNDGVTANPRVIRVEVDETYTAIFEDIVKRVDVVAEPTNGGTVTGSGFYPKGTERTITASPNSGYRFLRWSDGNTESSRTITVEDNITFTAIFTTASETPDKTFVKTIVVSSPEEGGIVEGINLSGGHYDPNKYLVESGTEVTLLATPNEGYTFKQWNDGITDNPRTMLAPSEDTTYTAIFEIQGQPSTTTLVTVVAEPTDGGEVTGGGEYSVGERVTLTASPNDDYNFKQWNDGVTEATRTITVGEDAVTYTAIFEKQKGSIIVEVTPEGGGTVSGAGDYPIGTEVTLVATPNPGYEFEGWDDGSSTTLTEPTLKVLVTKDDKNIIATFVPEGTVNKVITAQAEPAEGGTFTGAGTYRIGEEVTLRATPNPGYAFNMWRNTSNPDGDINDPIQTFTISDGMTVNNTAVFTEVKTPYTTEELQRNAKQGYITGVPINSGSNLNLLPGDIMKLSDSYVGGSHKTIPVEGFNRIRLKGTYPGCILACYNKAYESSGNCIKVYFNNDNENNSWLQNVHYENLELELPSGTSWVGINFPAYHAGAETFPEGDQEVTLFNA